MISELIKTHHNWYHYIANRLIIPTHPDHDDVVQEGRIAMWKNYNKYDGKEELGSLDGFLRMCARRRMLEIAYQRKPPTGGNTNKQYWKPPTHHLEDYLDGTELTVDDVLPPAPNVMESVELAYHQGHLINAINALPERHRSYVVLRFWGGLFEAPHPSREQYKTYQDLAPQFSNPNNRKRVWTQAKQDLAEFLDDVRTGYGD